jgi:hypothetical protein
MGKEVNPSHNIFNVAPVGNVVVIGVKRALGGGIARDRAINLLAWLIIATKATPDEVAAEIAHAHEPTAEKSKGMTTVNRGVGQTTLLDPSGNPVPETKQGERAQAFVPRNVAVNPTSVNGVAPAPIITEEEEATAKASLKEELAEAWSRKMTSGGLS